MVPKAGLEPAIFAEHGSEPCAYANSATPAQENFQRLALLSDSLFLYIPFANIFKPRERLISRHSVDTLHLFF